MTIFRCPLCSGPLWEVPGGLRCPKGHRFDRAKEGYVHLLPVGQKHSLAPGDDKAMVNARRAFLDRGWYAPLREALEQLAVVHTGSEPVVLDAGCGEGYYTQGVRQALTSAGKPPTWQASTSPSLPCRRPPSGVRSWIWQWPPPTICRWRTWLWTWY